MQIDDMLVFAEVVDKGGFTAAGEALGRPKSNISRVVSRLERDLGAKLLERTTRKHTLTEIGAIYYRHIVRIKEEIDSANATVENLTATPKGYLRVCVSTTVGQHLITDQLADFAATYPDIEIDLRLTNRRVDLIEEGFDIVIRVGPSPDSNLVAKPMCTQAVLFYASPDYLKSTDKPLIQPEDLIHHQCLYMNAINEKPRWSFQCNGDSITVDFKPFLRCDDFHTLKQLAIKGLGITQLPEYMCYEHLKVGELITVLDGWVGATADFNMLVPSRQGITPKVRAFLDYFSYACRV